MADFSLKVEVVTHVLGSLNHCSHCQIFIDRAGIGEQIHIRDLLSYPPDWWEEWQQFSDLIFSLTNRFAGKLVIQVTDAQTPRGLWLTLRRRIRRYPAFLIGEEVYQGLDEAPLARMIETYLP
ncbi:MAG TPA: hypothetical protein ENJ02_06415 [Chloroflexi bacterium]|nr:hypothetical protein [Chloroflexota bacterium]